MRANSVKNKVYLMTLVLSESNDSQGR